HARYYADDPSRYADHHRLEKELLGDIRLLRPDSEPQPDLLDPFQYGGEHNVHDPDPPYEQGYSRDSAQHIIKNIIGPLLLLKQQFRYLDLVVHHALVTPLQQAGDDLGRTLEIVCLSDLKDQA